MSNETLPHLNTNCLIGNTDARGHAWHYRAEEQGTETNHYSAAIPVADVQRRLFNWIAESRRIAVEVPSGLDAMTHLTDDGTPARWTVIADRQAICRSDDHTGKVMGIFAPGYTRHQYSEWLLTTVANILDDDLAISSAGLLKGGAIAWVEVSVPESITTPDGVTFRPNLLATTSFDGSIATTFKRTITDTVCDNTRECALSETGQQYKVKHSKYSHAQLAPAREALAMVHTIADDFAAEVAKLCAIEVTPRQWSQFLDMHARATRGRHRQAPRGSIAHSGRQQARRLTTVVCTRLTGRSMGRYRIPHTVSCRRSTPTNTTKAPCVEPAAPTATCSERSPATSPRSTEQHGQLKDVLVKRRCTWWSGSTHAQQVPPRCSFGTRCVPIPEVIGRPQQTAVTEVTVDAGLLDLVRQGTACPGVQGRRRVPDDLTAPSTGRRPLTASHQLGLGQWGPEVPPGCISVRRMLGR